MGYIGEERTSQDAYIYDTIPYNPEFDIDELVVIQNKLQDYTSGKTSEGITSKEAEVFLDWVTFNARSYATKNTLESAVTASMAGKCAPTQGVNYELLSKFGLDVRVFNMGECIGSIPMTAEDKRRVDNGWLSNAVRHAVSLVKIPIMDNNGNTDEYEFLLDPTFRQFCLKEKCNNDMFYKQELLDKGYIAPHPGYFMQTDNLVQLGVSREVAEKSENLGRYIVNKGYFYLSEENAKLYGDAFQRASRRAEFQNLPIQMRGKDYINNFENMRRNRTTYFKPGYEII